MDLALVAKIVGILFTVNLVLSGISAGLDVIKDKTETKIDDKAAVIVHAIASALKAITDFLSANVPH